MFGLSPRVFNVKPFAQVGILTVLDENTGITITDAGIDSDDPEINGRFDIEYLPMYGGIDESWNVVWKGEETVAVEGSSPAHTRGRQIRHPSGCMGKDWGHNFRRASSSAGEENLAVQAAWNRGPFPE